MFRLYSRPNCFHDVDKLILHSSVKPPLHTRESGIRLRIHVDSCLLSNDSSLPFATNLCSDFPVGSRHQEGNLRLVLRLSAGSSLLVKGYLKEHFRRPLRFSTSSPTDCIVNNVQLEGPVTLTITSFTSDADYSQLTGKRLHFIHMDSASYSILSSLLYKAPPRD